MSILKITAKFLLMPSVIALTLLQWTASFLNGVLRWILSILSGIIVLVSIASLVFRLSSGIEFWRMMAFAFLLFIIPHIVDWLILRIAILRYYINSFIWSRPADRINIYS